MWRKTLFNYCLKIRINLLTICIFYVKYLHILSVFMHFICILNTPANICFFAKHLFYFITLHSYTTSAKGVESLTLIDDTLYALIEGISG